MWLVEGICSRSDPTEIRGVAISGGCSKTDILCLDEECEGLLKHYKKCSDSEIANNLQDSLNACLEKAVSEMDMPVADRKALTLTRSLV